MMSIAPTFLVGCGHHYLNSTNKLEIASKEKNKQSGYYSYVVKYYYKSALSGELGSDSYYIDTYGDFEVGDEIIILTKTQFNSLSEKSNKYDNLIKAGALEQK